MPKASRNWLAFSDFSSGGRIRTVTGIDGDRSCSRGNLAKRQGRGVEYQHRDGVSDGHQSRQAVRRRCSSFTWSTAGNRPVKGEDMRKKLLPSREYLKQLNGCWEFCSEHYDGPAPKTKDDLLPDQRTIARAAAPEILNRWLGWFGNDCLTKLQFAAVVKFLADAKAGLETRFKQVEEPGRLLAAASTSAEHTATPEQRKDDFEPYPLTTAVDGVCQCVERMAHLADERFSRLRKRFLPERYSDADSWNGYLRSYFSWRERFYYSSQLAAEKIEQLRTVSITLPTWVRFTRDVPTHAPSGMKAVSLMMDAVNATLTWLPHAMREPGEFDVTIGAYIPQLRNLFSKIEYGRASIFTTIRDACVEEIKTLPQWETGTIGDKESSVDDFHIEGANDRKPLPPGDWYFPATSLVELGTMFNPILTREKVKRLLIPYGLRNWPAENRQSWTFRLDLCDSNTAKIFRHSARPNKKSA